MLRYFVVLGSSLLFMLQPLVGRLLLPMHGGSFQVWTTCMLFFQLALLAGYAYAHLVLARLGRWHRALLLLSLPCAPLALEQLPARAGSIIDILVTLTVCVAVPFVVLATTSIVAQMRAAESGADPYPLYAYSNIGSLIGLISYPLVFEAWLGLRAQRVIWAVLYGVYVLLAFRLTPRAVHVTHEPRTTVPARQLGYWICLSASACAVLLGMTNVFSLGAGSIPLIWVLTLAAYLLGFVVAFSVRELTPVRWLPELLLIAFTIYAEPRFLDVFSEWTRLITQLFCLFGCTWCACAELHRSRPEPSALTQFYLAIATGGAIGGVLTSLLAPVLLRDLYEYPIALLALAVTIAVARWRELLAWSLARTSWAHGARLHKTRWARVLLGVTAALLIVRQLGQRDPPSAALRNFYGLYGIWDYDRGRDLDGVRRKVRLLSHNGTNHGFQSRRAEEQCQPSGYYHRASALGELLPVSDTARRAAVIGLGAGALASYFQAHDQLTFYELDADTVTLAHRYFTYLDGCGVTPRIVLGDARIELARDAQLADHSLDVLIVDAFSGDSVPFHLLTREAQALYLRKLAPHGVIVYHVSSRFYELWPTVASTARTLGLYSAQRTVKEGRTMGPLGWSSQYLVVSESARLIDQLGARGWVITTASRADVWTDDRASLLFPLLAYLARR